VASYLSFGRTKDEAFNNAGIEYRYELQSSTMAASRTHEWSRPGDADAGIPPSSGEAYDTMVIETRNAGHPEQIVRTVRRLNAGAFDIAKDESDSSIRGHR
jgi:hypothetical protein